MKASSSHLYIVFGSNVKLLYLHFYLKNFWICYLNLLYFSNHDLNSKFVTTLILNNQKFLKYVDFSVVSLYQNSFYFHQISDILLKDNSTNIAVYRKLLNDYIANINPIKCLIFQRFISKPEDFLKLELYKSDLRVFYIHYNELTVKDCDIIHTRFTSRQDIVLYKHIYEKNQHLIINSKFLNNSYTIFSLLNKISMIGLIDRFIADCRILNLYQPVTFVLPLHSLEDDTNIIYKKMNEHNMKFPILLKIDSFEYDDLNHRISIIFDDNALQSNIKLLLDQYNFSDLDIIFPEFINHEGYLVKLYRLNQKKTY